MAAAPKTKTLELDLDKVIEKLLENRKTPGKLVALTEMEIRALCLKSREVLPLFSFCVVFIQLIEFFARFSF